MLQREGEKIGLYFKQALSEPEESKVPLEYSVFDSEYTPNNIFSGDDAGALKEDVDVTYYSSLGDTQEQNMLLWNIILNRNPSEWRILDYGKFLCPIWQVVLHRHFFTFKENTFQLCSLLQ